MHIVLMDACHFLNQNWMIAAHSTPHNNQGMLYAAIMQALPERPHAGAKLEVDEDDVPIVIPPSTAAHLHALADVLLRNGESGAFKAYVEVNVRPLTPNSSQLYDNAETLQISLSKAMAPL